jgi:hypothetical protein
MIETERAEHAEALGQLRRGYEHSLSWRVTRPLRRLRSFSERRSRKAGTPGLARR